MKKICLLLALMLCTAIANAGAVKWMYWGADAPITGGSLTEGCVAYLVAADTSTTYTSIFDTIKANQLGSLNVVGTGTTVTDGAGFGVFQGDYNYLSVDPATAGLADGSYNFYMAVFNTTATPGENDMFLLTDSIQEVVSTVSGSADTTLDFDQTVGDWTLISNGSTPDPSVPEPTVLALLALGVAGLALKRKVA